MSNIVLKLQPFTLPLHMLPVPQEMSDIKAVITKQLKHFTIWNSSHWVKMIDYTLNDLL
eukprot:Pgem_evm1s15238